MDLPVRIQTEPTDERVLSVDGAFGAPGLNLSHWPGNTTPGALRHDLSTGIALAFARLDARERARLTEGCVALVNNHYDTDGLCAMLAVLRPEWALAHESSLLAAAEAGDFFRHPTDAGFVVDAIVTAAADPERSPFREDFAGLTDQERHAYLTNEMLERLPSIVEGDVEPYRELWEGPLAALHADRRDLETALFDDVVHLDLAVWTAREGAVSSREHRPATVFDPGRHALFGATRADRQLSIGPTDGGTTVRFVVGTWSFFDLESHERQPRPDLAALAAELNRREGTTPEGAGPAWHHLSPNASPEVWFGIGGLGTYAEFAGPHLRPSGLDPLAMKATVIDALRETWVFPEEDEDREAV